MAGSNRSRIKTMRNLLVNVGLTITSVLVLLLLCEVLVFRFIFLPSDIPENQFTDNLIRYRPNQSGVTRVKNDIIAEYRINAQGWNSRHPDYPIKRSPGIMRIAIIGDSYVEAMQVSYKESLAEQLERLLGIDKTEVFRFGISGASLSHYLYMLEHEVIRFSPEFVVILIVHNDFDESFQFRKGRYTSSFMKLKLENDFVVEEIPPSPYKPDWKDWIRKTATVRYFYYRQRLNSEIARTLIFSQQRSPQYEANIDVTNVQNVKENIKIATDYIFARMKAVAGANDMRLLLIMDGVRGAVYNRASSGAYILNTITEQAARRHGISLIDLHQCFIADWEKNRMRFEFPSDGHWNEHGHQIAADAIRDYIEYHRDKCGFGDESKSSRPEGARSQEDRDRP